MELKTYEQVKTSDYEIGLTKVTDLKIKEIHGYLTTEYDEPLFQMTRIEFEDGSKLLCEGEHDTPYLTGAGENTVQGYTDENLESINKSDPDYEEEEDEDL